LVTVHLSIFISVINQLDSQNFSFTITFISYLYIFRAPCVHHHEVSIALHSLWYHQIIGGFDNHLEYLCILFFVNLYIDGEFKC
jgi:hypothetical protein